MQVSEALADAPGSCVVLTLGLDAECLRRLGLPGDATVRDLARLDEAVPAARTVVLAVWDRQALRRAASVLAPLGRAVAVGCWVVTPGASPAVVLPRPNWPQVEEMRSVRGDGGFTLVRFGSPAPVRDVLLEFARRGARHPRLSTAWPVVGIVRGQARHWPIADPSTVLLKDATEAADLVTPPDLVIAGDAQPAPAADKPSPVTGRPPATVGFEPWLTWQDCGARPAAEVLQRCEREGQLGLGGLDEAVLNPVGFRREHGGATSRVDACPSFAGLAIPVGGGTRRVDTDHGPTDTDVEALRGLKALRVGWRGGSGPHAYARAVAAFAMAGVPLLASTVPSWARLLLDPRLVDLLTGTPDVDDTLRREELSIRQRRAALRGHASGAWRDDLATRHGLPVRGRPRVSVLLATRRPDRVDFAMRQVARQRDVDLELVLATHGFEVGRDRVASVARAAGVTLEALPVASDVPFGQVLNLAAGRATGDLLLKMDDDDWYGPDFVSDLLLARTYSGADIVGVPSEFTFLRPLWQTVRRPDATERYRPWVAGGTMLLDRSVFADVGGFRPVRKYVDAGLLSAAVESGALVYRTHGLGYVLRRDSLGHTWDPGLGYFLQRKRSSQQWRGFAPSALLEPDPRDLPTRERRLDAVR